MKKAMFLLVFVCITLFSQEYKTEQIKDPNYQDPQSVINNMINEKMGPTIDELNRQGQMIKNMEEKIKNLPENQKKEFKSLLLEMKEEYSKKFENFQKNLNSEFSNQNQKIQSLEKKFGNVESSLKGYADSLRGIISGLVQENGNLKEKMNKFENTPVKRDTLTRNFFTSHKDTLVIKETILLKPTINNIFVEKENKITESETERYEVVYQRGRLDACINAYTLNFGNSSIPFQITPGCTDILLTVLLNDDDEFLVREKITLANGMTKDSELKTKKSSNISYINADFSVDGDYGVNVSGRISFSKFGKVTFYTKDEHTLKMIIHISGVSNVASR